MPIGRVVTFNHENNQKAWVGGSQHKPNSQRNGKAEVEGLPLQTVMLESGNGGPKGGPGYTFRDHRRFGDDITGSGDGGGRFLRVPPLG